MAHDGSHVFLCFVDFTKAFDKVNYWKLLNMLLDDGISTVLIVLLAFWFNHKQMCVKWNSLMSGYFTIGNGTCQGRVVSPYLLSRYIRGMLHGIAELGLHIGCYTGGLSVNIVAYANDFVILAPSWKGLQALTDKLSLYTIC